MAVHVQEQSSLQRRLPDEPEQKAQGEQNGANAQWDAGSCICYTLTCGQVFTPNAVRCWPLRGRGRVGVIRASLQTAWQRLDIKKMLAVRAAVPGWQTRCKCKCRLETNDDDGARASCPSLNSASSHTPCQGKELPKQPAPSLSSSP